MTSDRLITAKEIAELTGLHPRTITSYHARRQMPEPEVQYGRTPLWRLSVIEAWRAGVTPRAAHSGSQAGSPAAS